MEVLLLVVEFVEDDLQIGPGGVVALEESEHALEEEARIFCHYPIVDGLDLF